MGNVTRQLSCSSFPFGKIGYHSWLFSFDLFTVSNWNFVLLDYQGIVSRLVNLTSLNVDSLKVDSASYAQQFENAMNVNGGDLESATSFDYLMHFATFWWKVR